MTRRKGSLRLRPWLLVACLFVAAPALAADYPPPPGADEKPFAEARILLQVSDRDEAVHARVLNVANNLLKHYGGPDLVDIEIVAFGPGIAILDAGGAQTERVSSLAASGVRFIACMNTVDTMERTTGNRPELVPAAFPVQAGVAHMVTRSSQGYVLVRP